MEYGFVAYIDEAGDTGLERVRPIDPVGATEWLCLSCVLIRANNEPLVPNWVRDIRENIEATSADILHFRRLSPTRKRVVCELVAELPVRLFAVTSNKKNMRQYRNERAEKRGSQQWFYNWCIRLLVERITDYCALDCRKRGVPPELVKVEFARRGGHRYSQTSAYQELIKRQARGGRMYLTRRIPKWEVMNWRLFNDHEANELAGLQLADVVASAFYTAVDYLDTGPCEPTYAKALSPRMALECGKARDYGLTLFPKASEADLTIDQQSIFRFYGYGGYEFVKKVAAPGSRHRQ